MLGRRLRYTASRVPTGSPGLVLCVLGGVRRGERGGDVKYIVAPTPPSGPALQTGLTGPCVGVEGGGSQYKDLDRTIGKMQCMPLGQIFQTF